MAGRGPDERWGRLARLDRGEVKARPSGFPEERPETRTATSGAPGGARAGHTARGTSQRCQTKTLRRTGAPLPHGRNEGNEGGAPRLTFPGPMSHAWMMTTERNNALQLLLQEPHQAR